MALESPEFTDLRISASRTIDNGLNILLNRVDEVCFSITLSSLTRDLEKICSLCDKADVGFERTFNQYVNQAYVHGYKKGYREVTNINNNASVYVTNGIFDVAKRATDKALKHTTSAVKKLGSQAKEKVKSATSSIRSALLKGISKLTSRRKDNKPTEEDLDTIKQMAKQIVREELNKLDVKTKQLLQDEITSSASEGKLGAYEDAGIESVKVRIDTVHDERRCKKCGDLDGRILPLEQAKSIIPKHPNCRCMWKLVTNDVSKKIKKEQKKQEKDTLKLRDRLDKKYKQKQINNTREIAIHNEHIEEIDVVPEVANNISLDLDSSDSPYILLIKNTRLKKGKTGFKVVCNSENVVDGKLVSGSVLRLKGIKNNTLYYDCVGNIVKDKKQWDKEMNKYNFNSISLLPDTLFEYPYEIASDTDDSVKIVMVNSKNGYVSINNNRSDLMNGDDMIQLAIRLQLY